MNGFRTHKVAALSFILFLEAKVYFLSDRNHLSLAGLLMFWIIWQWYPSCGEKEFELYNSLSLQCLRYGSSRNHNFSKKLCVDIGRM